MDCFTLAELDDPAVDLDPLLPATHQMHFDAAGNGVPQRTVLKALEVSKVCATSTLRKSGDTTMDAIEDVEKVDQRRWRFFGTAALTVAAAQLGMSLLTKSEVATETPPIPHMPQSGRHISFALPDGAIRDVFVSTIASVAGPIPLFNSVVTR